MQTQHALVAGYRARPPNFFAVRVKTYHHLAAPVLDDLRDALADPGATAVDAAIAYAQTAGTLLLHDQLRDLIRAKHRVRVVVGVDMRITSAEALKHLVDIGVDTYAYRASGHAFHGKTIVISDSEGPSQAFVGSANWTYGGLVNNSEFTSRLSARAQLDRRELESLVSEIGLLAANARRLRTAADVALAITDFGVPTEVEARRRASDRPASGARALATSSLCPVKRSTISKDAAAYQRRVFAGTTGGGPGTRGGSGGRRRGTVGRPGTVGLPPIPPAGAQFIAIVSIMNDVQVRNTPGELRLPLDALFLSPGFWGYPTRFQLKATAKATFHERFVRCRFTSTNAKTVVAKDVRIYRYLKRSELRITSHEFRHRGAEDDIVVIRFRGQLMDCEIVRKTDTSHAAWKSLCTIKMRSGGKPQPRYWGVV